MKVILVSCLFVLDNERNDNFRKNDIKKIKVLVNKVNMLPKVIFRGGDMKKQVRNNISTIIESNLFHLEQVFTMYDENCVFIIYLGITNAVNITKLDSNYQLIDFKIENNNTITFGDKEYKYKTIEIEKNNNIEYTHLIKIKDSIIKRTLLFL